MVSTHRKRKRADYASADPPPFAPARLSLLKSYRAPHLPRSLVTGAAPPYVNLALMAGARLLARDFAGAAAALPPLFKRFRQPGNRRWFFTREVAVTGAEVLRRSPWAEHAAVLDDFLAQMARDAHLSAKTGREGYSARAREVALLERAMELLADGRVRPAFDALQEHAQEPAFQASALVQGYLGMVALILSVKEDDPAVMLAVAARSLHAAAELEPTAYFYVYYAAAAALAAGESAAALEMLRRFVEERNRTDPLALYGVLTCLQALGPRDAPDMRQERVDIARRLLAVDPLSVPAIDVLREAHAWAWPVEPTVDRIELAEVLAARIESGNVADVASWTSLGKALCKSPAERRVFWEFSGRNNWWPTHFFRITKLNADIATDPALASVKGAVAKMLYSPAVSPYAAGVEASGVVELYKFGAKR